MKRQNGGSANFTRRGMDFKPFNLTELSSKLHFKLCAIKPIKINTNAIGVYTLYTPDTKAVLQQFERDLKSVLRRGLKVLKLF